MTANMFSKNMYILPIFYCVLLNAYFKERYTNTVCNKKQDTEQIYGRGDCLKICSFGSIYFTFGNFDNFDDWNDKVAESLLIGQTKVVFFGCKQVSV